MTTLLYRDQSADILQNGPADGHCNGCGWTIVKAIPDSTWSIVNAAAPTAAAWAYCGNKACQFHHGEALADASAAPSFAMAVDILTDQPAA